VFFLRIIPARNTWRASAWRKTPHGQALTLLAHPLARAGPTPMLQRQRRPVRLEHAWHGRRRGAGGAPRLTGQRGDAPAIATLPSGINHWPSLNAPERRGRAPRANALDETPTPARLLAPVLAGAKRACLHRLASLKRLEGNPRTPRPVCQDIAHKACAAQDPLSLHRERPWRQRTASRRHQALDSLTWPTEKHRGHLSALACRKNWLSQWRHRSDAATPPGSRARAPRPKDDARAPNARPRRTGHSCPSMRRDATTARAGAPRPSCRRSPSKGEALLPSRRTP